MGSVMAVMTVAHSAGMLAGSVLAGVMMDLFSLRMVFPVGAAVVAVCSGVFYLRSAGRPAP
jgi:predicted MFS family arabinose efflux permease